MVVEISQTKLFGNKVKLVFFKVREHTPAHLNSINSGKAEIYAVSLAARIYKGAVKTGVMCNKHGSLSAEFYKFFDGFLLRRRAFNHVIGNACQLGYADRYLPARVNKGLKGILNFKTLYSYSAYFNYSVSLRAEAGGLNIENNYLAVQRNVFKHIDRVSPVVYRVSLAAVNDLEISAVLAYLCSSRSGLRKSLCNAVVCDSHSGVSP